jgi:2-dehydro-3-deoxyphosphooctonate aldolase (KDO 8-P synthase)
MTNKKFTLIAGPCAIESREVVFETCEKLKILSLKYDLDFIFKSSFRKANRTSINSFKGLGDEVALRILEDVKKEFDVRVTSDVHERVDVEISKDILDIIQIPAYLIRQTDLLEYAAKSGKTVNLKKAQFLPADSMVHVIEKLEYYGCNDYILTERGTVNGTQDIVVDFRNIPKLKKMGTTIVDITHTIQKPNQIGGVSGGEKEYIELMGRSALINGSDGIFMETHPNIDRALSDSNTMIDLNLVDLLLGRLVKVKELYDELYN